MVKTLSFFVLLILIGFGASFVSGEQGLVTIDWLGYKIEGTVGIFIGFVGMWLLAGYGSFTSDTFTFKKFLKVIFIFKEGPIPPLLMWLGPVIFLMISWIRFIICILILTPQFSIMPWCISLNQ